MQKIVTIKYSPLSQEMFDDLLESILDEHGPFRLWGNPIHLGPRKVHIYGAKRGEWIPINIEITDSRVVILFTQTEKSDCVNVLTSHFKRYFESRNIMTECEYHGSL